MTLPLQLWLQAILNGLALGWLYVLMALGLTFILSMAGILQLAHGEVYMIGAFTVYYFAVMHGVNLYVAILVSMVTTAILGLFLERIFLRPLKGKFLS